MSGCRECAPVDRATKIIARHVLTRCMYCADKCRSQKTCNEQKPWSLKCYLGIRKGLVDGLPDKEADLEVA